jgi:hypothetical protein
VGEGAVGAQTLLVYFRLPWRARERARRRRARCDPRNAKRAHRVAHRIKAGTVWINHYGAGDVSVPFGGFKQSGHGREMGQYALELYTEVKSVIANLDD